MRFYFKISSFPSNFVLQYFSVTNKCFLKDIFFPFIELWFYLAEIVTMCYSWLSDRQKSNFYNSIWHLKCWHLNILQPFYKYPDMKLINSYSVIIQNIRKISIVTRKSRRPIALLDPICDLGILTIFQWLRYLCFDICGLWF